MLRACPRCGRIHDDGLDCDGGKKKTRRSWGPRKATTASRVRESSRWKRTAREVKEEAHNMCELCYSTKGKACAFHLEVHHIVPLEEDSGRAFDRLNLICLCNTCHREAEAGKIPRAALHELAKRRERGEMLRRD